MLQNSKCGEMKLTESEDLGVKDKIRKLKTAKRFSWVLASVPRFVDQLFYKRK